MVDVDLVRGGGDGNAAVGDGDEDITTIAH